MFALGGGVVAYAQTDEGTPPPVPSTTGAPQSFLQKVRDLIENRKEVKTDTTAAVQNIKQETQSEIKDIRESVASSTDKKTEVQDLRQTLASTTKDLREKLASTTQSIKTRIEDAQEKAITNRYNVMTTRYLATIQREQEIMAKLSSRIGKIKAAGSNTDVADKLVIEAQTDLTEAQTAYSSLAQIASSTTSDLEMQFQDTGTTTPAPPKAVLDAMKNATTNIEKYLKAAQQAMEKAVGSLLGSSQTHSATSTQETN